MTCKDCRYYKAYNKDVDYGPCFFDPPKAFAKIRDGSSDFQKYSTPIATSAFTARPETNENDLCHHLEPR